MTSATLSVSMLLFVICTADGFLHFVLGRCKFNSTESKDIEYIYSMHFNKEEIVRFSSRVGKYVGLTDIGKRQAEHFNNNPAVLERRRNQKATYCDHNIPIFSRNVLAKSVEPYVVLSSMPPPPGHHATLVCSAFKFYPKEITVEWQINGKTVTSGVSSTDVLTSGDWYNQIHSHLEYTPGRGKKISCVVHHRSLKKPLVTDWDPLMPESERNKIAIGVSGLVLGLIFSLAGFIYYKNSPGRILVPSS
ncbi:H-2 class II histocompatibility antigen, E-S beta chain-like [Nelusetta ayraudi]|uniref:H-2 class II histocompatibility antigen, E-S beta chain-like n=1 Tax=Nelusetta ayraudi TaxID=303726 RepID=UPI003F7274D9